jgi:hypothetical protein
MVTPALLLSSFPHLRRPPDVGRVSVPNLPPAGAIQMFPRISPIICLHRLDRLSGYLGTDLPVMGRLGGEGDRQVQPRLAACPEREKPPTGHGRGRQSSSDR